MKPSLETLAGLYRAASDMLHQGNRAMQTVMDCAHKHGYTEEQIVAELGWAEIPIKQWFVEEAERGGHTRDTVKGRYYRGKYPALRLRRTNKRVVVVQTVGNEVMP